MSGSAPDDDRSVRYRSRSGVVGLGVWSAVVAMMGLLVGWEAVGKGGVPWVAGVPLAVILAAGLYSMYVELTVTGNGELVFRGLVRRRHWDASRLRSIRPGNLCVVFRFDRGGAMLAWWQPDPDWATVVNRIRDLNPGVQVERSLTGSGRDAPGT